MDSEFTFAHSRFVGLREDKDASRREESVEEFGVTLTKSGLKLPSHLASDARRCELFAFVRNRTDTRCGCLISSQVLHLGLDRVHAAVTIAKPICYYLHDSTRDHDVS
jgi:hypothetical protein